MDNEEENISWPTGGQGRRKYKLANRWTTRKKM
jgi:hypothetical protein